MFRLLRAATLLTAVATLAAGPPPTPMVGHVDRMFGMAFSDPYHWMEDGGPAFGDWLSAEMLQ
jgi:protease II